MTSNSLLSQKSIFTIYLQSGKPTEKGSQNQCQRFKYTNGIFRNKLFTN